MEMKDGKGFVCSTEEIYQRKWQEPFDWKILQVDRCSYRCLQEIMYAILNTGAEVRDTFVNGQREMLIKPDWTSAEILVRIPHKLRNHQSNTHTSNLDFFTKIRGVTVKDPPTNFMGSEGRR